MACWTRYLMLIWEAIGLLLLNVAKSAIVEDETNVGLNISQSPSAQLRSSGVSASIKETRAPRSLQETTIIGNVMSLVLMDTDTNLPIRVLLNNTIINLAAIKASNITIDATTTSLTTTTQIEYVLFEGQNSNGIVFNSYSFIQWSAPYALCGDWDGELVPCNSRLPVGSHTVSATPYLHGVAGVTITVKFTIVDTPPIVKSCSIPYFTIPIWRDFSPLYPIRIKETHGVTIGSNIVIVSGFTNDLANATNKTYARDVVANNGNTTWRQMDDLPVALGITHAAFARVGQKIYMCGGFYGGNPGLHIPDCYVYDHTKKPGFGRQWSRIRSLPNEGTGGGGMVYDSAMNALYYVGGGIRDKTKPTRDIFDVNVFYKYELHNPNAGWTDLGSCPYVANHLSAVTAFDKFGNERHFFLGGQIGKDECQNNLDKVFEWNAITQSWTQHTNIPFPRGHAPSSTLPISCGFVIAGGSINSPTGCFYQTADISYYDIESMVWTPIGNLSNAVNAPVCSIKKWILLSCEWYLESTSYTC